MARFASSFTMAGWAGFHAVSTAIFLSAIPDGASLDPVIGLVIFAHAATCVGAFVLLALHRTRTDRPVAEAGVPLVLLAGLALAALAHGIGIGGGQPGLYALCVAATLLAFHFDAAIGAEPEEEVDHEAFMREAARLGASLSPRRNDDRRSGSGRR